jgi:radical SAM superfamily enzyme YgiQ (UPF0313 family)
VLIYLADLGHNLLTVSSDVYPLGIANQATYLPAILQGEGDTPPGQDPDLDIRIFREPQDLRDALDARAPDMLGLSNYAWNQELSRHFARYAKQLSPDTFTCMGGPNWPLTEDVKEIFMRERPEIDAYIDGPTYEGERAFVNLVRRFREVGGSRDGVMEQALPGNTWIDPRSDQLVVGEAVERIRDLDDIPSPYLSGLLDPWFETGYFPLLQIARGCPFSCAFCNSGVPGNSKINAHSIENVKADLEYVAKRVKPEITLCMADDNFGMYPRDEDIADYIGWLQETTGWPKYIRTTTGKNNGERIIRVMRKTHGALPMTAAVQSMNPEVLKNIKRSNIKLETYMQLQEELERQGMQSYGELILCLPGESRESFLKSVEALLDAGAKRVSAHQLMLLHGADLATPAARERFGSETRFRVVARNIGNYTGEPVVEVEEMVVQTPTFSFDDYLEMRIFHLLLTIFYYEGNFEEAFELANENGVKPFDLVMQLHARLDEAPADLRKVIDDFVRESQEELFPDRESCLEWSSNHYDQLVDGTLGGNLLSKYSMIGRFYATEPGLDYLHDTIAHCTSADSTQLDCVIDYLRQVLLRVPFEQSLAEELHWTMPFDVEAWCAAHYEQPLAEFACEPARPVQARVESEQRTTIETKLKTFGEHPSGLGKFTRTLFARDLRRTVTADRSPARKAQRA